MTRRILIDTHILIWWLSDSGNIRTEHRELIADPENIVCVSMISIFELYIKASIGKMVLPEDLIKAIEESDISTLELKFDHFEAYRSLPVIHKDPFDKLIIAQAISEQLPLISYDQVFAEYPIDLL